MKLSGVYIFLTIREKNFQSNLVLVIILFLESKGLYYCRPPIQDPYLNSAVRMRHPVCTVPVAIFKCCCDGWRGKVGVGGLNSGLLETSRAAAFYIH